MDRNLWQLSTAAAATAAQRQGSTLIWPWGSLEQHGPHLPLGTDALFAERLLDLVLERLPDHLPLWRLPPQCLGFSPEHQGFAGTLSLPAELLIAQVVAIGSQIASAGFRRLVLFNAHGGQIALLQTAARQLRARAPGLAVLPCFLWSLPHGMADLIPEPERSEGLHAALAETSLMLHLAPELVGELPLADGKRGPAPPAGWSLEGAAPSAWLSRDISESGVIGDPGGASASLGERLSGHLVDSWCELLLALMESDWPQSGAG